MCPSAMMENAIKNAHKQILIALKRVTKIWKWNFMYDEGNASGCLERFCCDEKFILNPCCKWMD